MGIYRTNDPTQFSAVDGIIIDESAPPPALAGQGTGTAILVGQFERGPVGELITVGSVGELYEIFGKASSSGLNALQNKRFASLKIIRVAAAAAVVATGSFNSAGAVPTISFSAKSKGAFGNSIRVTISAGSTSGSKYVIEDTSSTAVMPLETFDNVLIVNASSVLNVSQHVVATVLSTAAEPAVAAPTPLTGGANGTVADTDYQTAMVAAESEGAGNVMFLDVYNAARNGYLKAHAANMQDKMVIVAGPENETEAEAITAAGLLRDSDARIIYSYPWVRSNISGVDTYVSPASFYASVISQTGPHIDPAFASNTQFLSGITGLKKTISRSGYIALKNAGISAFEYDADIGFKIKSGITTQIADTSKLTVLRRRMTDYLTISAAKFLKAYQNAVNSSTNRTAIKGAILAFVDGQQRLGLLPRETDVKGGLPTLVDVDSLNTDTAVAAGFCYVIWKQRIFSSMRYIVVRAQIGESVVVTES